jgi:hypothetical protein
VRELKRAEDDQEGDEQAREEVVAADVVVPQPVRGGGHDETGLGSRELALAEKEVGEREREDQRDDAGEDDPQRAPHRDPAQEPTDQRRTGRAHDHARSHGQRRLVDEDHGPVAADPGQRADAQEELVGAPEDQVEADAVGGEHQRLNGQRRGVRRVSEPDGGEDREDRRRDGDRQKRPADDPGPAHRPNARATHVA